MTMDPWKNLLGSLDDLYRVETTFQTNVCMYTLVKPDAEDGKSTAELVRRSLCKYPETMYLNLHETHFSIIQDVCMYCDLGEVLDGTFYEMELQKLGGVRGIYPGVVDDAYAVEMNKKTVTYTWDSSFYGAPRCACCSSITTLSTGRWSAPFFSTARWIQTPPIWPWPPMPS